MVHLLFNIRSRIEVYMEFEETHIENDSYTLLQGMFATQLPPLLDDIINPYSSNELIKKIKKDKDTFKHLFDFDDETGLINKLSKEVQPTDIVYGGNWGTEAIKFFTLKKDLSWRPMAIPNIKLAVMFAYNSLILEEEVLNFLYTKDQRLNGITKHSESPIIGLDNLISAMFYDEETADATGFIGYDGTNRFFNESKLQRFELEYTRPFVLQLDLSKFFENIYTHSFAQINAENIILGFGFPFKDKVKIFKSYLEWLDNFNQKVNDNHTKGIIQGPISSKISAELLQLSIDQSIDDLIKSLGLDITFTRYVDDYRFFARQSSDLELIKHHLTKIFRKYELSFNTTKSLIYRGFEVQKQANLSRYPEIKQFNNTKTSSITIEDYLNIHDLLIYVVSENDIPTLKALLSIIKKKLSNNSLNFTDEKITTSMVIQLIKMAYVAPVVVTHAYTIIDLIIQHAEKKVKDKIWNIFFDEITYIEENYSSTDLEVWFFYVISNAGNSKQTRIVFRKYEDTKKHDVNKYNVLVLTVLIKRKSKATNDIIQAKILSLAPYPEAKINDNKAQDSENNRFWNSISQTKWWLPISKLWICSDSDKLDNKIKGQFLKGKSNIKWDKLGIIQFLNTSKS